LHFHFDDFLLFLQNSVFIHFNFVVQDVQCFLHFFHPGHKLLSLLFQDFFSRFNGLVALLDQSIEARKEILKEQRKQLMTRMKEMQKTLDILDHKIEVYENAVLKKEKEIIEMEV